VLQWSCRWVDSGGATLEGQIPGKTLPGVITLIPLVTFAAFCSNSLLCFSGVAVGLMLVTRLGRTNSRKDVAGSNNPDPLSYLCCLLFKFSSVLQ
jgi:hypothetical protein